MISQNQHTVGLDLVVLFVIWGIGLFALSSFAKSLEHADIVTCLSAYGLDEADLGLPRAELSARLDGIPVPLAAFNGLDCRQVLLRAVKTKK